MNRPIRVLVVDDDEPRSAARSLERAGYECALATTGREALRLIEEQRFDIVLTELVVDGVEWPEVLATAKNAASRAKVVILTGRATLATAVSSMRAGAATYLIKPLDVDEIRMVASRENK